jgi:hypothetical protein
MTQLERLKIKLGIAVADTTKDNLLIIKLEDAKDAILELIHLDEVPQRLLSTQEELVIIAYNKLGIEGQTSHSEGGISRSFEDIPESMMKKIRSCRKLPR